MKYIALTLAGDGQSVGDGDRVLNAHFDDGWQYVDSITQNVSTRGSSHDTKRGAVIVILKKEDKVML